MSDTIKKTYFSVYEAAKMLSINPSHVRFLLYAYEPLFQVKRGARFARKLKQEDIDLLSDFLFMRKHVSSESLEVACKSQKAFSLCLEFSKAMETYKK